MSKIIAAKVNALPSVGNRSADTMYFVKSADPNYVDLYMTSLNASETRRIINKSDIDTLIATAISNALFKETGIATPRTLQSVINANLLYRSRAKAVELFTSGYNLQTSQDIAVIAGTTGNNYIDILDTSGIIAGQDYLLADAASKVIIQVDSILSSTRLQLTATLAKNWDGTAVLTGSTLVANNSGGADAAIGAQWISKKINLGNDDIKRTIVIRRTANTGVVRVYFKDSFTTSWTEVTRVTRQTGNDTNGIPTGYYDDKYLAALKGDGYLRIVTETAVMTVKHLVVLAVDTVSVGDFFNDSSDVVAFQTAIDSTPNSGTQVVEVPGGNFTGDFSTLSFGSRKIVWIENTNTSYTGTAPSGIRNPIAPVVCNSIKDLVGMKGLMAGQQIHVASYYDYNALLVRPRGGGYFLWDPTKAKTSHNGVTIISPSVPWNGLQATLAAYIAKTGETNAGGSSGCWMRQYSELDVFMGGAVGDKVADDLAAFNAVKAIGESFYVPIPTVKYKITDMLTLDNGQTMRGDGRTESIIYVDTDFNMAALGVIRLATSEPGATLLDIGIEFNQDTTVPLRANVIHFPDAIYAVGASRFVVDRVRISKAWNGLNAKGNTGGAYIGRLEVGALNKGLQIDGALDFIHIESYHHWPFDFAGTSLYTNVYSDGNTVAFECGVCDGLNVDKLAAFRSKVVFTAVAATNIAKEIGVLQLDGDNSILDCSASFLNIGQLYSTKSTRSVPTVDIKAGVTIINSINSRGAGVAADFQVSGGQLQILGGYSNNLYTGSQGFLVNTGTLILSKIFCELPAASRTAPYIEQTGGIIKVDGCDASTAGANPSSHFIKVGVDDAANRIQNNLFGNWGYSLPANAYLGCYGANRVAPITYTPTVSFATNGDFVPTYTLQTGRMWHEATGVRFEQRLLFNTNAYTTATGNLQISGPPVSQYAGLDIAAQVVLQVASKIDLDVGYSSLGITKNATNDNLLLRQYGDNAPYALITAINVPAGVNNIELVISGFIPTV